MTRVVSSIQFGKIVFLSASLVSFDLGRLLDTDKFRPTSDLNFV